MGGDFVADAEDLTICVRRMSVSANILCLVTKGTGLSPYRWDKKRCKLLTFFAPGRSQRAQKGEEPDGDE